jgi:voltage-dependent potassium channel beta subunit
MNMHYRRLGRSGLKVSELSFGSWVTFGNQLDQKQASDLIHAAYDHGVNYFDNADMYADGKAELLMGKAIQDLPRQAIVISSKVFWQTFPGVNGRGLSRKHLAESVDASLKRLGLEYLDLYFCHRFDPDTPIEEVVRTMTILIEQGKILYWGTSEWEASQIAEAFGIARQYNLIPPSMEQPQYNLFHAKRVEEQIMPLAVELGLGLTTWSPLYHGLLTGKYNDGLPAGSRATLQDYEWIRERITPERIACVKQLAPIATELGITTGQLALAWILRRKEVSTVITGATRLEQLDENLAAAEAQEKLTNDVLEQIEKIFTGAE